MCDLGFYPFPGIGFGLMYLPSIVMVGFYFDKKRALATGIATCGSGIGAFIFAPMTTALIQTYSWIGAQWIVAAIVLHGVIFGALYRYYITNYPQFVLETLIYRSYSLLNVSENYRPLTERDMEKYKKKWRQENAAFIEACDISESQCGDKKGNIAEEKGSFGSLGNYANHLRITNHPKQSISLEILSNLNQWDENSSANVDFSTCQQIPKAKSMDFLAATEQFKKTQPILTDSWHSLAGYASSVGNLSKPNGHYCDKDMSNANKENHAEKPKKGVHI